MLAPGSRFFKQIYYPYAERDFEKNTYTDLEELFAETMWTGAPSVGTHIDYTTSQGYRELREGARRLREKSQRAIVGIFGGNMFEIPQFLYGIDKYLLYMGLYPADCERLSAVLYQRYSQRLETWLEAVGEYIDISGIRRRFGLSNGPFHVPANVSPIFQAMAREDCGSEPRKKQAFVSCFIPAEAMNRSWRT